MPHIRFIQVDVLTEAYKIKISRFIKLKKTRRSKKLGSVGTFLGQIFINGSLWLLHPNQEYKATE